MKTNSIIIIAKPTSECNFRCGYCYHADTHYERGFLSYSALEKLIKIAQREYEFVDYIWHGGEPLLCGLDYFQEIIKFQKKYTRKDLKIINSVQTNGSLLSKDYIEFFKDNNIDVSISIDGPEDCNVLRQQTNYVLEKINLARIAGLKISTISVIHALNVDKQIEMYEYFKSLDVSMKFNPVYISGNAKENPQYLLDADIYIDSLKNLYDYWLVDKTAVKVDPIDQYLNMVMEGRGLDCIYNSCLYHWIGVDHNGLIYPCGRSFPEEYIIGNIQEIQNISDIYQNENYLNLLKKSIVRRSKCLSTCEYYEICNGGCNNNALIENGDIEIPGGFLCIVLKEMIDYIKNSINTIYSNLKELDNYNPIIKDELNQRELEKVLG